MLPIGPLMIEHRLIERVIALARKEADRLSKVDTIDRAFVRAAVDFMRTYADRVHHGKEEDILFDVLEKREIAPEDRRMIEELRREHVQARALVGILETAGEAEARDDIVRTLREMAELYPQHIEKEDKRFFPASMEYVSDEERDAMLEAFREFDRNVIHERYRGMVEILERTWAPTERDRSAQ